MAGPLQVGLRAGCPGRTKPAPGTVWYAGRALSPATEDGATRASGRTTSGIGRARSLPSSEVHINQALEASGREGGQTAGRGVDGGRFGNVRGVGRWEKRGY